MSAFDTPTGPRLARSATPSFGDAPEPGYVCGARYCDDPACGTHGGGGGGEVDLLIYCTVTVAVTVTEPYTADELAELAAGEVGWQATFVSVDRVETDRSYPAPPPAPADDLTFRGFLARFHRG